MTKAKSDKSNTGLTMIPWYSIIRIGKIFVEGLRYGRDNWKKGVFDKEYQEERLEHAFVHLIKYKEGDTTEDHLAKVAWFCVTQMELMRLESEANSPEPANDEPQVSEGEIAKVEDADIVPLKFPLQTGTIYRNREGRDVTLIGYSGVDGKWLGRTCESIATATKPDYSFRVDDYGRTYLISESMMDLAGQLKDQGKYSK